jgi:hypothetical protein
MKRQVVATDGVYRIWSGSTNKNKGLFIATVNGVELFNGKSMSAAQQAIDAHRRKHSAIKAVAKNFPEKTEPLLPDTEAWLKEQIGSQ